MARIHPTTEESAVVAQIVCPLCHTMIDATTDVCHQCGAHTEGKTLQADPKTTRLIDRPWLILLVILHVGILGIPVYWRTRHSVPARLMLILLSGIYTVFAVWFIIWGVIQIARAVQILG